MMFRCLRKRAEPVSDEALVPLLLPNMFVLAVGSVAVAILSFGFLPWPYAIASTILGILMVAAADIDARTMLLPDSLTFGAALAGLFAAFILESDNRLEAVASAVLKAVITASLLACGRKAYASLRGVEGIGLGDVKLAAAIGAWLPVEQIPYCFVLASLAGLLAALFWRDKATRLMKLPFGAFLCPALWLLVFINFFQTASFYYGGGF